MKYISIDYIYEMQMHLFFLSGSIMEYIVEYQKVEEETIQLK